LKIDLKVKETENELPQSKILIRQILL